GPRPVVHACYTSPPKTHGAPRWIRTNIPRLSSACPALGRGVHGAASGFRPRDLLVGTEASCWLDYGRNCFLAARAGVEPAARCFKDSSPYRYRVPGSSAGERIRTSKPEG